MTNAGANAYGLESYVETASQIAARFRRGRSSVLARMLLAKLMFGLSAVEYGHYGLHAARFSRLRQYQNKKQTTELFARINPAAERPNVEDKLRFHRLCVAAALPVPTLHAVLSRRGSHVADFPLLERFDDVVEMFAGKDESRLILKPQNDALGTGVRFVSIRDGRVFDIAGGRIDAMSFASDLAADMRRDDYLVQEFVRPHAEMALLGSGKALGTFRVVTRIDAGGVDVLYALARIPCGANVHDNFSGGRTGNLIASIDVETGVLHAAYGRRDARWSRLLERFDDNPDTGRPIRGRKVPMWNEILDVVRRGARIFPSLPALGWDVALSDRGVVVIEANSNPDIIGVQVSSGLGAREVLGALYGDARKR